MGATSVTGVGQGSADGKGKGAARTTLGASHLIGPRVVVAGTVSLDGSGNGSVKLPLLPGVAADYVVVATVVGSSAGSVAASLSLGSADTTVAVVGPNNADVAYVVLKVGVTA